MVNPCRGGCPHCLRPILKIEAIALLSVLRPGFETPRLGLLRRPTFNRPLHSDQSRHWSARTIAVPGDEPSFVVVSGERDERGSQVFDGIEGPHPQQVLLQGSDERSATPLPSGSRTKEGEASIPRHSISPWKSHVVGAMIVTQLQSTRYAGAMAPKHRCTPWRTGSSASKRRRPSQNLFYTSCASSSPVLISGLSCKTTFNKELWTSSFPLYSIKPNLRNLFMKKLTRDRVVPIISASVS